MATKAEKYTRFDGRALRRHEGKTDAIVHDYLNASVPILKAQHSWRRIAYRQTGFRAA